MSREVADPRVGFATITSVETTPDLRHAKVWVSVIGQPAERDATVAALRRAMPFVRHELGTRLRIRRIPDLHVQLDDTAERGTRVLQLLTSSKPGARPNGRRRRASRCRRRSPGCRTRATCAEEPPSAVRVPSRRRRARRADQGTGRGTATAGHGAREDRPMTVDLDAVPRRRPGLGRRRPAARGAARPRGQPREPRRRHARRRARRRPPGRGERRHGRRRVHGSGAAAVRVPAGDRALPDRSRPGAPTTTSWSSPTAARSSGSARSATATPSCSRGCPGSSSTITPPTTPRATPTGSIRTGGRDLRDGRAAGGPPGCRR